MQLLQSGAHSNPEKAFRKNREREITLQNKISEVSQDAISTSCRKLFQDLKKKKKKKKRSEDVLIINKGIYNKRLKTEKTI